VKLATIGYEQKTLPEMIDQLKRAKVEIVVDVRAVAASRRPGFSKTMLATTLASHGIEYLHLRQLGTPKDGRIAARAGRIDDMHAIFEKQLETPAAQLELAHAREIVTARRAALLCFEADAARCHRAIVAEHLCAALGCEIENL
jgi:uncharacterized protein (DUF488 family)